jgi:hypothetical protein
MDERRGSRVAVARVSRERGRGRQRDRETERQRDRERQSDSVEGRSKGEGGGEGGGMQRAACALRRHALYVDVPCARRYWPIPAAIHERCDPYHTM